MSEDARAAIHARMRAALGRSGSAPGSDEAAARVRARLEHPPSTVIPKRAALDPEGRIRLFTRQAEAVQASVRRIEDREALPGAVAEYLRAHNLPRRLVSAAVPELQGLDWAAALIEARYGRPEESDQVGLTGALAGVAETGTLMLASAAERPTMLAFLPDTVIVALDAERVLPTYEDALAQFKEVHGALPRSVNFVTGPSRSGDIEQTLQLGAHGPRRLHVVLIGQADPQA
jgi:L-lactate dehydrogenase complex protein LldG